MSVNTIAIAKASLVAPFVKPDPVTVSREEINELPERIAAALHQCSQWNIQNCREWLCKNATSPIRATAVGKYLTVLSASIRDGERRRKECSARRQRLHLLYVLNDWFHHLKYHSRTTVSRLDVLEAFQTHADDLLRLAASFDYTRFPKLHGRLKVLLEIWEARQYFEPRFCKKLLDTLQNAGSRPESDTEKEKAPMPSQNDEALPFVMPSQHGDPSSQWYDLPAANMLPHMIANDSTPIDPHNMAPLQFRAGPADSSLITLVKDFMREAVYLYDGEEKVDEGTCVDFDALGQKLYRNEVDNDTTYGETYYGWSKEFSEKMRRKKRDVPLVKHKEIDRDRGRFLDQYSSYGSSIGSPSRSRSRTPSRRRETSFSRSGSRVRGRIDKRSRSRSERRLQSYKRPKSSHKGSRSSSATRLDSSTPRGRRYSGSRPYDREKSYSPGSSNPFIPPPPMNMPLQNVHITSSSLGTVYPPNLAQFLPPGLIGPGGNMPSPPPRPPGWQGLWPPPPPPLPPPPFVSPQGAGRGAFPSFPPSFGQGIPPQSGSLLFQQNYGNWQPQPDPRRRP